MRIYTKRGYGRCGSNPWSWRTGERHPLAKLTAEQVEWARGWRAIGIPLRIVAQALGVTVSTTSKAVNRVTWRHTADLKMNE